MVTQEDAVTGVSINGIGDADFTVLLSGAVSKHFQYDAAGNRTLTQDAAGFTVQKGRGSVTAIGHF